MTYKLKYFDIRGRGEDIRLIFTAAGVKFVDDRIPGDAWAGLKPNTTWGQLPVLEIGNDKSLSQSISICRYLARKFKLTGANEWEAAKCDEYVDAMGDLFQEWVKFFFEADETLKAEKKAAFVKTTLPKYLTKFNTIKHEAGGNFLVGKEMTWADIFIADKLERLESSIDVNVLNGYPHLRKLKENVLTSDRLKAYVDARKPSPM